MGVRQAQRQPVGSRLEEKTRKRRGRACWQKGVGAQLLVQLGRIKKVLGQLSLLVWEPGFCPQMPLGRRRVSKGSSPLIPLSEGCQRGVQVKGTALVGAVTCVWVYSVPSPVGGEGLQARPLLLRSRASTT